MSLYLPRFSHLTGSLAGLAGFAIVLGNDDKDNLARLPGCTSKATALAGCFAATALSHWMYLATGHRYRQRPPPGIHPTPSRVYKGTRGAFVLGRVPLCSGYLRDRHRHGRAIGDVLLDARVLQGRVIRASESRDPGCRRATARPCCQRSCWVRRLCLRDGPHWSHTDMHLLICT